jgi:hypothetical protein
MYRVDRGVVPRFWKSIVSVTKGLPWESAEIDLTASKTLSGLKSCTDKVLMDEIEVTALGVTSEAPDE